MMALFSAVLPGLTSCSERGTVTAPPAPARYPRLGIPMKDGKPDLANVSITFDHTRCFVACPDFSVSLSGDGTGLYTGRKFVVSLGPVPLSFDPHDLEPILDVLEEVDVLSMDARCCWDSSGDSSNTTLTVTIAGRSGSFQSQMPCPFVHETPEHITVHARMEAAVDSLERIAGVQHLVGTAEEAYEHRAREKLERR